MGLTEEDLGQAGRFEITDFNNAVRVFVIGFRFRLHGDHQLQGGFGSQGLVLQGYLGFLGQLKALRNQLFQIFDARAYKSAAFRKAFGKKPPRIRIN